MQLERASRGEDHRPITSHGPRRGASSLAAAARRRAARPRRHVIPHVLTSMPHRPAGAWPTADQRPVRQVAWTWLAHRDRDCELRGMRLAAETDRGLAPEPAPAPAPLRRSPAAKTRLLPRAEIQLKHVFLELGEEARNSKTTLKLGLTLCCCSFFCLRIQTLKKLTYTLY
jgi:hypothetical protein